MKIRLLMLLMLFVCGAPLKAELAEDTLKAVLVEKFTHFIDWPQAKETSGIDDTFLICVLGSDSIAKEFEKLALLTTIQKKTISVKTISRKSNIKGCDLAYLSEKAGAAVQNLLEKAQGLPVLTVGDDQYLVRHGAMISVYTLNDKLSFSINLKKAKSSDFEISSRILKLANEVIQ